MPIKFLEEQSIAPTTGKIKFLDTPSLPKTKPANQYLTGGLLSKAGDILSTGSFAQVGLTERLLEQRGVLKPTETSGIMGGLQQRKSNIELLRRIGSETGRGGLLTGQYTPTTSVWHNFVREIPVTTLGIAGDIFLDPT